MTQHILEHFGRGLLLGAVFVMNVFFVTGVSAYQVSGGSILKVIQSGGYTGSTTFQVRADLKPMAHPDEEPNDVVIPPVVPPVNPPIVVPSATVPVVAVPQSSGGGQKYDASGWILKQKYDELVLARDENLKTSAPKNNSIIPTALANVKLVDTYKPSTLKNFVSSPKSENGAIVSHFGEAKVEPKKVGERVTSPKKETIVKKSPIIKKKVIQPKIKKEETFHKSPTREITTKKAEKKIVVPFVKKEEDLEISYCLNPISSEVFENQINRQAHVAVNYQHAEEEWGLLIYLLFSVFIAFFIIILLLMSLIFWITYDRREKRKHKVNSKLLSILPILLCFGLFGGSTLAVTTTPQKVIYEGVLSDNAGNAVTGSYDFRFSFWDNQDYELSDNLGGTINVVASDFLGWQEVQTQNIVNQGKFSFQVGTVVPFTPGLFDRVDMNLQIEVKASGTADSGYELIDLDMTNPVIDRMVIDSVPYAFNADKLDFREAGFGAGQIPYLDLSGKFPDTVIPVINNALHADGADNATTAGGKAIGYNADEIPYQDITGKLPNSIIPDIDAVLLDGRDTGFTAGDIPYIDETTGLLDGDIIETGINPGDIARVDVVTGDLDSSIIPDIDAVLLDGHDTGYNPGDIPFIDVITGLLPSSILPSFGGGAGANIPGTNTESFVLDVDDTALATDNLVLQFGNTLNETIMWNGVNSRFEISDDLKVNGDMVVSGDINGVTVGLKNYDDRLSPRYPNSIIEKDGTNNDNGYMYEEEENILGSLKSYLRWMSTSTSLQDYDVIIRYTLKDDFSSLRAPGVSLEYITELTSDDSKLDLTISKEGVVGDQLGGSGIGLTSNAWVNQDFTLTGGATWSAGDVMVIRIKMHSKNNTNAKIADIVIHTVVE